MKIFKMLFALVALFVSAQAALAVTVGEFTVSGTSAVACTMDVKLCPDGVTYVGRTGPSCAFALCPNEVPPAGTCVDLRYNLEVGSTDSTTNGEVTKLQTFLYPNYLAVAPTGRFYGMTQKAVMKFQREYGITPVRGYVGAVTRAKIKELTCGGTSQTLAINSITPSYAKVGGTVALTGPGLNSGGDFILFDGHRIEKDDSKALNRIGFVVPEYITNTINCVTTPCPLGYSKKVVPGVYTIQVVNSLGTTNTVNLTVTDGTIPPPTDTIKISWVEPTAAKVGTSAVIYGYNLFRAETRILFDGVSIPGKPVYSKRFGNFNSALEFVVPTYLSSCNSGVCTASATRRVSPGWYELAVDNRYGRDAVKFEVLGDVVGGKPYLNYLNPAQGMVGVEVSIFGENINTGSEKVYFGGSLVRHFLPSGTDSRKVIRFRVPEYTSACGYESSAICSAPSRLVTPGNYDVIVKNNAGVSNALTFTVTSSTTNPPTISGISGPQVLNVGQVGTWTVTASNSVGGNLSYSVLWGDEGVGVGASTLTTSQQTATFTHAYSQSGMYTPRFTVTNTNGQSATASLSVNVGNVTTVTPKLNSLTPSYGVVGTGVTIRGEGINIGDDKVYFKGALVAQTLSISADIVNTLRFEVPSYITSCGVGSAGTCKIAAQPVTPGVYEVVVVNKNGTSNTLNFSVTSSTAQTPVITSINPIQGTLGTSVSIVGNNFSSNQTIVEFRSPEGVLKGDVLPSSITSTNIQFNLNGFFSNGLPILPGMYKVGVVTNNCAGGCVSNSISFTVTGSTIQTPTISSFTPTQGSNTSSVTVYGTNFITTPSTIHFLRFVDAQGNSVGSASTITSATSPTSAIFPIPTNAPTGSYRLQMRIAGNDTWSNITAQTFTLVASAVGTVDIGFDASYTKAKTVTLSAGQTIEPRFYLTSANIPSDTTACYLQKKISGNWEANGMAFYPNRSEADRTYFPASPVGVGAYEYRYKCGSVISQTVTFTVVASSGVATADIGFDASFTKSKTVTLSAGQTTLVPGSFPLFYLTSVAIPSNVTTCIFQKKNGITWDTYSEYFSPNQAGPYLIPNIGYTNFTAVGAGTHVYRYACGTTMSAEATLTVNSI